MIRALIQSIGLKNEEKKSIIACQGIKKPAELILPAFYTFFNRAKKMNILPDLNFPIKQ